jgi:hypothetical protein
MGLVVPAGRRLKTNVEPWNGDSNTLMSLKKNIAVAVSRLMDRVFATHPRLKPGAKCCRSYAAKHSPKQRTKTCAIPSDVNPKFLSPQASPRGAMIATRDEEFSVTG